MSCATALYTASCVTLSSNSESNSNRRVVSSSVRSTATPAARAALQFGNGWRCNNTPPSATSMHGAAGPSDPVKNAPAASASPAGARPGSGGRMRQCTRTRSALFIVFLKTTHTRDPPDRVRARRDVHGLVRCRSSCYPRIRQRAAPASSPIPPFISLRQCVRDVHLCVASLAREAVRCFAHACGSGVAGCCAGAGRIPSLLPRGRALRDVLLAFTFFRVVARSDESCGGVPFGDAHVHGAVL
jgi:hypothetical protein